MTDPTPFGTPPPFAPPAAPRPVIGRIGDDLQVVAVCSGGMGEVYLCKREEDERPTLALKTFQKRLFYNRSGRHAFLREASVWLRLSGLPHIMPALGLYRHEGRVFVAMPAVDPGPGGAVSVRDLLRGGPLPPLRALEVAFQVVFGLLQAGHHVPGVVHGDLKPENLLMLGGVVHVSDFGLARVAAESEGEVSLEGTWTYRAPECWDGDPVTPASDIYAYGTMLYEFLTGTTPYAATSRDGWAAAHRDGSPRPPGDFPPDGLPSALMGLALHCLARRPGDRPGGFGAVHRGLGEIGEEHATIEAFQILYEGSLRKQAMEVPRKKLRAEVVSSLLDLGERELALAELEAIPEGDYGVRLWGLRGTALSLLGRDAEALAYFDKALGAEADQRGRSSLLSEKGLSLKRLGRHQEAIDLFEGLLNQINDDATLSRVVTNLGTVYHYAGRDEEAKRLLSNFTRRHPDVPHAWANLGLAHEGLKEYLQAERSYRRALQLAPDMIEVQLMYGAMLMDRLGRVEDAAEVLDMAFDQGVNSRTWFVRFLACNFLLGREDVTGQLLGSARHELGREGAQALLDEALTMARKIAERHTGADPGCPGRDPAGDDPEVDELRPPSPHAVRLPGGVTGGDVSRPGRDHWWARLRDGVAGWLGRVRARGRSVGSRREGGAVKFPFLNYRLYADQSLFSIDYYDDPMLDNYVSRFAEAWEASVENSRFELMGVDLVSTPLYFTECPGCRTVILTDRDHGKPLRCRGCQTVHPTSPMDRTDLDDLLNGLRRKIRQEVVDPAGEVQVLLVRPPDEARLVEVEAICRRAGFEPMGREHPMAAHQWLEARKRGLIEIGQKYSVWQKPFLASPEILAGKTPPDVTRLVRELRDEIGTVLTMSTTFDPRHPFFDPEKCDEVERMFLDAITANPGDPLNLVGLSHFLIGRGRLEEAERKARASTVLSPGEPKAWHVLALAEMRLARFGDARGHFERAVAIDPTDRLSLRFLAHCYQMLGDDAKAAELVARVDAMGGPF